MRLNELNAKLLTYHEDGGDILYRYADSLTGAHGVQFLCPKCFGENGGPVGTHLCLCWFVGKVPDSAKPGPGRWNPSGSGIADLTFVPSEGHEHYSIQLNGGCNWHGYIENGETRDCG